MKQLGYLGIDQYGTEYHIGDNPPLKWLKNYLGCGHASKIYEDTKDGKTRHVGYAIKDCWITIYRLCNWKEAQ